MTTSKFAIMSDEIIHIKCCVCLIKNRTREADNYCVDCKDYYCSPCTEKHKLYPASKGHNLLDKADFCTLGPDGSLPSFVTQRCVQHQTEVNSMYCKEHDEVACSLCIVLYHRSCTNIHNIPDDIDNLYNRIEFTDMKQKNQETMKTLREIKTAKEKDIKKLKEVFDKEVDSVHAFRQELEVLLEQETISTLNKEFENIESHLMNEIKEVNKLIESTNEVFSLLKKSEGNRADELVSIKSSEKVTTKIIEDVEKEHQKRKDETVRFIADQNIKTFLQQMQAFGKVVCNKNSITCVRLYQVKNRREINVKLASDTSECDVEGSCLTGDGFLLITNRNNNKLKRLDMSTETVKDFLDLQESPHDVCQVSKEVVAEALYDTKSIQFVSLGNKLSDSRQLSQPANHSYPMHDDLENKRDCGLNYDEFYEHIRRRTKRYYVGGFKPSISEDKIARYVRSKGLTCQKYQFLETINVKQLL